MEITGSKMQPDKQVSLDDLVRQFQKAPRMELMKGINYNKLNKERTQSCCTQKDILHLQFQSSKSCPNTGRKFYLVNMHKDMILRNPSKIDFQGKFYKFSGYIIYTEREVDIKALERTALFMSELTYIAKLKMNDFDQVNELAARDLEAILVEVYAEISDVLQMLHTNSIHLFPAFYCSINSLYLEPKNILGHMENSIAGDKTHLLSKFFRSFPQEASNSIFFNPKYRPSCLRVDEFIYSEEKITELVHFYKGSKNSNSSNSFKILADSKNLTWHYTGLKSDVFQSLFFAISLIYQILVNDEHTLLMSNAGIPFDLDRSLLLSSLTNMSYSPHCGPFFSRMVVSAQNIGTIDIASIVMEEIESLVHPVLGMSYQTSFYYEKLEFLGDSVLDFLVTIPLFYNFSETHQEGALTQFRSSLVNNKGSLGSFGHFLDLSRFRLIGHSYNASLGQYLSNKINADIVEALFGAVYYHGREFKACFALFQQLFNNIVANETEYGADSLYYLWCNLPQYYLIDKCDEYENLCAFRSDLKNILVKLETSIKYKIKNPLLFLQALNIEKLFLYKSLKGDNQNLEWLGDAVLKVLTSLKLFSEYKQYNEGKLTQIRSSLISNTFLKQLSIDIGLPELSKELCFMTVPSKRISDLVESVIGAIFVDSGLQECSTFCEEFIFAKISKILEMKLYQDPKALLNAVLSEMDAKKQFKVQKTNPTYKVLNVDNSDPKSEPIIEVGVFYKGHILAKHKATKAKTAGKYAAVRALKDLKNKSKLLKRLKGSKDSSLILQKIHE